MIKNARSYEMIIIVVAVVFVVGCSECCKIENRLWIIFAVKQKKKQFCRCLFVFVFVCFFSCVCLLIRLKTLSSLTFVCMYLTGIFDYRHGSSSGYQSEPESLTYDLSTNRYVTLDRRRAEPATTSSISVTLPRSWVIKQTNKQTNKRKF